jgi:hypothetical protein
MVAVAVAAAFLSRGSLATIFRRTSMQKAILESRIQFIQFTTLLKAISEEWDETINNSGGQPGGRVNLDTLVMPSRIKNVGTRVECVIAGATIMM